MSSPSDPERERQGAPGNLGNGGNTVHVISRSYVLNTLINLDFGPFYYSHFFILRIQFLDIKYSNIKKSSMISNKWND